MYIHLTAHSAYSLQEGLALPAELAQAAAAAGMPALGVTDHRLLSGAVEFVTACKEADVQPLLGLEIDLETGLYGAIFYLVLTDCWFVQK
jgi:DNA polymerase III alpha subunit